MQQIVYDTLMALRATTSKNAKLAILEAQKDNAFLREYLRMTYEPRINFYVKTVQPELATMSMMSFTGEQDQFTTITMGRVYENLAKRNMTGNAARQWLACLHHELDEVGQELLRCLIQGDVQAGISEGTINNVWPGLVTDPPYMRCSLPKEADLDNWPWAQGVYSQIKADGMFANINHNLDDTVTIESRAGSPMPLDQFGPLVAEIKNYIPKGWQVHGELLMLDKQGKIMPRHEGNGLFNSLLKEGELEKGYTPIYHAWDLIPISEARAKNKYKKPYKERFKALEHYLTAITEKPKLLTLIEYKIVYSLKEAYAHAREAMLAGLEGTVVKHPEAIWEDNTSKFQVKLKLEFTVELRVKRMKAAAAKSKNAKTFGSLECESECGMLEVSVTGIKDAKRKYIFDHFDAEYKDKIIAVTTNGIMEPSKDTKGKYSLFLPRFDEERFDKTKADDLKRIREIQEAAILGLAIKENRV